MTVAEIFAGRGEAEFRAVESEVLQDLARCENLVIATGGGALVSAENRAAFSNAHVFCLDASAEEILARLNGAEDRPLLQGDKRGRIQELLEARREAYQAIPQHVNTDGRTPGAIATELLKLLETRAIPVRTPEGEYSIYLGTGLLDRVGELLGGRGLVARCAIVTNPVVRGLYGERVEQSLLERGFEPTVINVPDGEEHKNLQTVSDLYERFIDAKLERRSAILALGGGVIGDTVGFAAATYLRGVPFVQIPTTLLSMVDSSIGGKAAVDLPAGKNLVGAFKFPACVIADLGVLRTLPVEELRAGMAEVIKHGILGDAILFRQLEEQSATDTAPDAVLVERALRVKIKIVERDPFEENVRAQLNLGHTFGQAIERLAQYKMRHGYAVAMGVAAAARLAANLGYCAPETRDRILGLFEKYLLPSRVPAEYAPDQIVEAMGTDKKIQDGKLRLILPREIGRVEIVSDVARPEIVRALEQSY
jgi:3-dehydroquinate synthase